MNTSTAITSEEACFLLYNDLHRLPTKEPLKVPPDIMQALCMTQPHTVVYRLLAETRDPVHGKGEQALTYELARQIAHYRPKEIPSVVERLMRHHGCGRDFKHLCRHLQRTDPHYYAPVIQSLLSCMNHYVYHEYYAPAPVDTNIGKWVPREKSSFGDFYDQLALNWAQRTEPHLLQNIGPATLNKCRQNYRRVLSELHARHRGNAQSKPTRNHQLLIKEGEARGTSGSPATGQAGECSVSSTGEQSAVSKANSVASRIDRRPEGEQGLRGESMTQVVRNDSVSAANRGPCPLIKRALLHAKTGATPTEIATIEQQWTQEMAKWPALPDHLPILVSTTQEPPTATLHTFCCVLYKTTLGRHYMYRGKWRNASTTSLVNLLQDILTTPVPTLASTSPAHYLNKEILETVRQIQTGLESLQKKDRADAEKILHQLRVENPTPTQTDDFAKQLHRTRVEPLIPVFIGELYTANPHSPLNLHEQIALENRNHNHIVYLHKNRGRFTNPSHPLCPPIKHNQRRGTLFPLSDECGLTDLQWRQLTLLKYDTLRHRTPAQAIMNILLDPLYVNMDMASMWPMVPALHPPSLQN